MFFTSKMTPGQTTPVYNCETSARVINVCKRKDFEMSSDYKSEFILDTKVYNQHLIITRVENMGVNIITCFFIKNKITNSQETLRMRLWSCADVKLRPSNTHSQWKHSNALVTYWNHCQVGWNGARPDPTKAEGQAAFRQGRSPGMQGWFFFKYKSDQIWTLIFHKGRPHLG